MSSPKQEWLRLCPSVSIPHGRGLVRYVRHMGYAPTLATAQLCHRDSEDEAMMPRHGVGRLRIVRTTISTADVIASVPCRLGALCTAFARVIGPQAALLDEAPCACQPCGCRLMLRRRSGLLGDATIPCGVDRVSATRKRMSSSDQHCGLPHNKYVVFGNVLAVAIAAASSACAHLSFQRGWPRGLTFRCVGNRAVPGVNLGSGDRLSRTRRAVDLAYLS